MTARRIRPLAALLLGVLLGSGPAMACSVCFGDPNSSLTQGAKAGILLLMGVIATVLLGIVAVTLYWIRRARMLEAAQAGIESAVGAQGIAAPRLHRD
jgi:hypothetical protein